MMHYIQITISRQNVPLEGILPMVHAIFVLLVPMVLLLEFARSVRLGLSVTLLVHFSVTSALWARPRLHVD